MSRLIAVGDIHGEITKLRALIQLINPTPEDELVFLGDYIDRGEDSAAVLDFLIQKQREFPKWQFLLGNHEVMMMMAMKDESPGEEWDFWLQNGGEQTMLSYQRRYAHGELFPSSHADFFNSLQVIHACAVDEDSMFVFVHAGFDPDVPVLEQLAAVKLGSAAEVPEAIWGRGHIKADLSAWEEGITVVCGHTPQKAPLIRDKVICIDTGAAFTHPKKIAKGYGALSAIDVRSKHVYRVGPEVGNAVS